MPIHDWNRAEAGDFHDFHLSWVVRIADALNRGLLPPGYMAILERNSSQPIPDVVAEAPSTARALARSESMIYAKRANHVVLRQGRKTDVATIEILSPGNKQSRAALRAFVEKAADMLSGGVNLLVVDLFPPTPRDPKGIHKAIWDELDDEPFEPPPGKPLTVASYLADDIPTAYVRSQQPDHPAGDDGSEERGRVADVIRAVPILPLPGCRDIRDRSVMLGEAS